MEKLIKKNNEKQIKKTYKKKPNRGGVKKKILGTVADIPGQS